MVYKKDEDENPIHDQQDLDDYEALEYRVILEKDKSSKEKPKDLNKINKNEKPKNIIKMMKMIQRKKMKQMKSLMMK